ncbi:MAG TPA: DUF397 domain-containing protein [Mycobacteriales bacterium]|jgi:Domain of unknown function (DUF397).
MTPQPDLINAAWRKSSYSGNGANCVEVAFSADAVAVRDSKNSTGPTLVFTPADWTTFLRAARAGHLTPTT